MDEVTNSTYRTTTCIRESVDSLSIVTRRIRESIRSRSIFITYLKNINIVDEKTVELVHSMGDMDGSSRPINDLHTHAIVS